MNICVGVSVCMVVFIINVSKIKNEFKLKIKKTFMNYVSNGSPDILSFMSKRDYHNTLPIEIGIQFGALS